MRGLYTGEKDGVIGNMNIWWIGIHVAIVIGLVGVYYVINSLMKRIRFLEQSRMITHKALHTDLSAIRKQINEFLSEHSQSRMQHERILTERFGRLEDAIHQVQQKLLATDDPKSFEIKK